MVNRVVLISAVAGAALLLNIPMAYAAHCWGLSSLNTLPSSCSHLEQNDFLQQYGNTLNQGSGQRLNSGQALGRTPDQQFQYPYYGNQPSTGSTPDQQFQNPYGSGLTQPSPYFSD